MPKYCLRVSSCCQYRHCNTWVRPSVCLSVCVYRSVWLSVSVCLELCVSCTKLHYVKTLNCIDCAATYYCLHRVDTFNCAATCNCLNFVDICNSPNCVDTCSCVNNAATCNCLNCVDTFDCLNCAATCNCLNCAAMYNCLNCVMCRFMPFMAPILTDGKRTHQEKIRLLLLYIILKNGLPETDIDKILEHSNIPIWLKSIFHFNIGW